MNRFAENAHQTKTNVRTQYQLEGASQTIKYTIEYLVFALGVGNCSPGSSGLYLSGVPQAQKIKESEDERTQLRAS